MTDLKTYYCINCGNEVKTLFKKYSTTVLKLTDCDNCSNIADKYVEYDIIIIIIDLVLLRKTAYRHVLFNADFKNYWKLSITFLLMESYSEWMLKSSRFFIKNDQQEDNLQEVYMEESDFLFYKIFWKIALRTISFVLSTYLLTKLRHNISVQMIWKTLTVSSFGTFLFLPSLIWDISTHELNLSIVSLYTMLSQLLAYTVICNCHKAWSLIVIFSSYYFKTFLIDCYDIFIFLLFN